jgi:hypothetical protein
VPVVRWQLSPLKRNIITQIDDTLPDRWHYFFGGKSALAQCEADGHRVTVAVVDQAGVEKVILKGDGAGPHTFASSVGKAFTAASMRRATGK